MYGTIKTIAMNGGKLMSKWVYRFSEGDASMRALLGGKGANLAEMTGLGMPIPQGFTVTTEACTNYYDNDQTISEEIQGQIFEALAWLEEYNGKKFGDNSDPLLVSVRSGARASMPGMMDTILNLGLNDVAVEGFAAKTGNPRFAYDSYRRFIQMFSDVVMEVSKSEFEKIIDEVKAAKGVKYDTELTAVAKSSEYGTYYIISCYKWNSDETYYKIPYCSGNSLLRYSYKQHYRLCCYKKHYCHHYGNSHK